MPALPERLRGGMEDQIKVGVGGGACCCCLVFLWVMVNFFSVSVTPNEYGMLLGKWTGKIAFTERGGIHFRWSPFNPWYKYPATQVTIMWADKYAMEGADDHPIFARSGHDHENTENAANEASGQPVTISCSLQYKYKREELPNLFYTIGEHDRVKSRYMVLARFAIIAAAQEFSPNEFWLGREKVTKRMSELIDKELGRYFAELTNFQIIRVEFMHTFEDSVIQTQVAEQQITINGFTQDVTKVTQGINVLDSENQAAIAAVSSNATAASKVMTAEATKEAFALKQTIKATMYTELKQTLEFDNDLIQEYIKIKSLMQKSQNSPVVVNIPAPDLSDKNLSAEL